MIVNRTSSVLRATILLLAFAALGLATVLVQAQTYPLPKPKPKIKSKVQIKYPLPKPNPRRRPGVDIVTKRNATPPAAKSKRPSGSRAAEADDTEGPGSSRKRWSTAEIAAERKACAAVLKDVKLTYTQAEPIGGPGDCGIAAPIKVTAIGARKSVKIEPAAVINCNLAAAAVRWIDH